MRSFLVGLVAVAACMVAVASSAQAIDSGQLPPDLQRALAAARMLKPRHLSVQVHIWDRRGHQLFDRLVVGDSPAREETRLSLKGYSVDLRYVGGREYDRVPGLAKLTGGHRWVSHPYRFGSAGRRLAALFDSALIRRGLVQQLALATSVQELGPVTVTGHPATAFSMAVAAAGGQTQTQIVDVAANGQIVRESGTSNAGGFTATVSTSVAVRVTRPPISETAPVAALAKRVRSHVTHAIDTGQLDAYLPFSLALGLL